MIVIDRYHHGPYRPLNSQQSCVPVGRRISRIGERVQTVGFDAATEMLGVGVGVEIVGRILSIRL